MTLNQPSNPKAAAMTDVCWATERFEAAVRATEKAAAELSSARRALDAAHHALANLIPQTSDQP